METNLGHHSMRSGDAALRKLPFALLLLAAPQDWLLHVAKLPNCCVLPIIAEDGFRFPSPSYYEDAGRGLEHCCSLNQSI